MSPIERVEAVLRGEKPDRPPFSFWYHFPADAAFGERAVAAHLQHLETYHIDFLKVMNDNSYPLEGGIHSVADLESLTELAGNEAGFGRQLELIDALRGPTRGRVPIITTVFNAWAVLRQLIQPPHEHHPPDYHGELDAPSRWIIHAWKANPAAVERALQAIGASLANFAARCVAAGADGIFLSVRDDWVDALEPGLYRRLVEPIDRRILGAAQAASFNLLHVCGRAMDFRRFAEYPAGAMNWADRIAGPAIADVRGWLRPAICAGLNHERILPEGSPRDVVLEIADAIQQARGRPIMIAPGCTFDPARVPKGNLQAIASGVQ
jgi:uroporphyrinogen decarboxylase